MLDFDSLLFNIDIKAKIARPGSLLIAEPFLRESCFNHSVIQLVDYGVGRGAMGVVMNQPTGYTLQKLIGSVTRPRPIPVYCGGPMSCDRLFFIHSLSQFIDGSSPISDNLSIGGDFSQMVEYINAGYPLDGLIRFFVGYSGWDDGQLDQELRDHVWAVADPGDAPASKLMTLEGDAMWHELVRALGPDYRGWRFYPKNISAN
ncbi:MAG: YqgE/AlgH family protein [Clostridium sp.]|nr:YqgE/AlgH family protein [Clostridium sp.]